MAEPKPSGVMPYLTVVGGVQAIAFYRAAFAAEEFARHMADDGVRVLNSHLGINGGSIMLSDHFRELHGDASAPPPAGVTLHLQVVDADAWFARATEAGCTVLMPLADQFWGDRYGQLKDPFGHTWSIAHVLAKGGGLNLARDRLRPPRPWPHGVRYRSGAAGRGPRPPRR